ncbi:hypothetical protein DYH09_04045 [bacterium CPR1]|nr:hypothetical protein [bacterium CPR1]
MFVEVALLLVLALQLVRAPGRTNPPVEAEPTWSPQVGAIVRRACYDCHSNETRWPWYSKVAPLSWWLIEEVNLGRERLNFSTWNRMRPSVRKLVLERSIARALAEDMAPASYRMAHPEASLTEEDRMVLQEWLAGYREELKQETLLWELFHLPAGVWDQKGSLPPGSWKVTELKQREALEMAGGLLMVEGKIRLPGGVRGYGVLLLCGQVEQIGPVEPGVTVLGPGQAAPERPVRLFLPDLSERVLVFCRDDGELGELYERTIHVLYGHGSYLLLEPELERGIPAHSVEQALRAAEHLLAQDPSTSLAVWRRRFRRDWQRELQAMALESPRGAHFELHPGERLPR